MQMKKEERDPRNGRATFCAFPQPESIFLWPQKVPKKLTIIAPARAVIELALSGQLFIILVLAAGAFFVATLVVVRVCGRRVGIGARILSMETEQRCWPLPIEQLITSCIECRRLLVLLLVLRSGVAQRVALVREVPFLEARFRPRIILQAVLIGFNQLEAAIEVFNWLLLVQDKVIWSE